MPFDVGAAVCHEDGFGSETGDGGADGGAGIGGGISEAETGTRAFAEGGGSICAGDASGAASLVSRARGVRRELGRGFEDFGSSECATATEYRRASAHAQ